MLARMLHEGEGLVLVELLIGSAVVRHGPRKYGACVLGMLSKYGVRSTSYTSYVLKKGKHNNLMFLPSKHFIPYWII